MPSDTLFSQLATKCTILAAQPISRIFPKTLLLIFLQKRNANVKYKPPFTITPVILRLVSEISELVGHVQALSGSTSPFLRKENRIRTIHASLAIENNTLTLEQVTAVLNGKHVLGQPREIQEVRNTFIVDEHLETWNLSSQNDILAAHTMLMAGLLWSIRNNFELEALVSFKVAL